MRERTKHSPSRRNRFEALAQEIMKALYLDRSEALDMAAEMIVWELIFAARTAGIVPKTTQSVA